MNLARFFSCVSSTFLYLLEANNQAIDPSCLARKFSIENHVFTTILCLACKPSKPYFKRSSFFGAETRVLGPLAETRPGGP